MYASKRLMVLGLVPLLCALSAFAQTNDASVKKDNLYSIALFASISEMEKQWDHIDDSWGGRKRTDYRNILVEKDPDITGDLPLKLGDHQIEYLDYKAMIDRYKNLRKEFSILHIYPIHNDGAQLKIHITVFWFSYKKGRLDYALSDWSDVEFRYDCAKQSYVISTVKLGGI
jgi:hypothetical protein